MPKAISYRSALTPGGGCGPSIAYEWITPSLHSGTGSKPAPPPGAPPQSQHISKNGTTYGKRIKVMKLAVSHIRTKQFAFFVCD